MRRLPILATMVIAAACGRDRSARPATHYGLGRAATPAEIAAEDIAVGPDGEGLPAGHGSAEEGAAIYKRLCASCHGPNGAGIEPVYPPLVGRDPSGENFVFGKDYRIPRTIGNYWPYATTVFDYVRRAMPLLAPGSLTNDEVYAVTAYLLAANRVIPMTTTLDAQSLKQVKMPYANRFVVDNRKGGPEVK